MSPRHHRPERPSHNADRERPHRDADRWDDPADPERLAPWVRRLPPAERARILRGSLRGPAKRRNDDE